MVFVESLNSGLVFAFGLTQTETIGIVVAIVVVGLLIVFGLARHRHKAMSAPAVDSCPKCNSMNMNNRGGLVVCMDCGASVNTADGHAG